MRSLIFNYLNILLFALLTFTITAQPSEDTPIRDLGTISNDGDTHPKIFEFCLDDNNQLVVKVNILLGGLQIMGEYPNEYGVIPSEYDDMFVEFSVNGETNTVPVGNFDLITLPNGFPGYRHIAESDPFDFSDECNSSEEGFIDVVISYRLVTPIGVDLYDTYPACDYDNNMFSCSVYPQAPWCDAVPDFGGFAIPDDEPGATCYDSWFSGSYAAWLYCDCGDEEPIHHQETKSIGDFGNFKGNSKGNSSTRLDVENNINVFPNPMGEMMNIESNNESIRQIEIYNSRGDLIVNNSYTIEENQNVTLNTTELATGLYLVRVATDSGIKVIKVLK